MPQGQPIQIEARTSRVIAWLRSLVPKIYRSSNDGVREGVKEIARQFRGIPYPPYPSGSRHQSKRTYKLQRSWQMEKKSEGVYALVNRAKSRGRSYGVYPVGDERGKGQAWMHVGRWWLALTEFKKRTGEITKRVSRAIRRSVKP